MPEIDPVRLDAIDAVIDEKGERSGWDPDAMRSALLEVSKGESQDDASADRDFDQSTLSRVLSNVEEEEAEIRKNQDRSSIFRDPVEEAKSEFMDFFDDLDERYQFGLNDRAVQMLADELETSGDIPHPLRVKEHLKGTKSGVSGADIEYIVNQYENWVSKLQESWGGPSTPQNPVGYGVSGGGRPEGGGAPHGRSGSRGIPISNPSPTLGSTPSSMGSQHQQDPVQNQRVDPEVESLRREIDELKEMVAGGADNQSASQKIKVESENGRMMEMTIDQAEKAGFLDSGDDGNDLLETAKLLKELGLIDDDDGSEMASEIGQAIESLGEHQMQAQQQIAQNFQTVLDQMQEMQEDSDEDVTRDDIREVINEEMKEDEIDRLERQLKSMQSEFSSELREAKKSNSSVMDDPEMFKTDRELEFRRQQLETLNENMQEMPTRFAAALNKGVIPLLEQMDDANRGAQLWEPPDHSGGQNPPPEQGDAPRRQARAPTVPAPHPEAGASQQRHAPPSEGSQQPAGGSQEPGAPRDQEVPPREGEEDSSNAPPGGLEGRADEVYEKLGIGAEGGSTEGSE